MEMNYDDYVKWVADVASFTLDNGYTRTQEWNFCKREFGAHIAFLPDSVDYSGFYADVCDFINTVMKGGKQ